MKSVKDITFRILPEDEFNETCEWVYTPNGAVHRSQLPEGFSYIHKNYHLMQGSRENHPIKKEEKKSTVEVSPQLARVQLKLRIIFIASSRERVKDYAKGLSDGISYGRSLSDKDKEFIENNFLPRLRYLVKSEVPKSISNEFLKEVIKENEIK